MTKMLFFYLIMHISKLLYYLFLIIANGLIKRITLPASFCVEVRKKIIEMSSEDEGFTLDHENHSMFNPEHDRQLLMWLHR